MTEEQPVEHEERLSSGALEMIQDALDANGSNRFQTPEELESLSLEQLETIRDALDKYGDRCFAGYHDLIELGNVAPAVQRRARASLSLRRHIDVEILRRHLPEHLGERLQELGTFLD